MDLIAAAIANPREELLRNRTWNNWHLLHSLFNFFLSRSSVSSFRFGGHIKYPLMITQLSLTLPYLLVELKDLSFLRYVVLVWGILLHLDGISICGYSSFSAASKYFHEIFTMGGACVFFVWYPSIPSSPSWVV